MNSPENSSASTTAVSTQEQFTELPEGTDEIIAVEIPAQARHASRLHNKLQSTKRVFQTAVVAAEANHITNEGVRYGAFGLTLAETGNPVLAGAVLGGSTLLVEGAGALAAASLLSADNRGRMVDWAMKKGSKVVPQGKRIPPAGEFGVAMVLGTPVLMGVKNLADPERTLKQNRRHGLFTASWLAALFAAEGAVLGKSVEEYQDPKMLAAGAIAIGGLAIAVKYSKSLIKRNTSSNRVEDQHETPVVTEGLQLTNEQIEKSTTAYNAYRDEHDEGVRIGLFDEDLQKAFRNPQSVMMRYKSELGEEYYAPVLVPLNELEWYNTELFKKLYGDNTKLYYYTRPPLPTNSDTLGAVADFIKDKLNNDAVIVTDWYESSSEDALLAELTTRAGNQYTLEDINSDELQRKADVFAGLVIFEGITDVKNSQPITEVYRAAVAAGELEDNPHNGVSLMETIESEEAERIWEIYEAPFVKLTEGDPVYAGFDKESLMEIMHNPKVAKIVNRVEGKINSLCFFVEDFENCPWFNPSYYEKNFPEYYNTGNVLIFPGIVSDEQTKGSSFSGQLIDLAVRLYAKRGSNALITFECTEISTRYIPRIVTRAINNTGIGEVSGLEQPLSTIRYSVLKKANSPA